MTQDVFEAFERLQQERERKPEDLVSIKRYGKEWRDWRTAFQNAFTVSRSPSLLRVVARDAQDTNPKAMMELLGIEIRR